MRFSDLPQDKRDTLKALVRSQSGWKKWREDNGVKADAITNAVIAKAITDFGLEGPARLIVYGSGSGVDAAGLVAAVDAIVAGREARDHDDALNKGFVPAGEPIDAAEARQDETPAALDTVDLVDAAIDNVLAPIRPFLAGSLIADVEARLRPLAEAANKPAPEPVVVVQGPPPAPGQAPYASITGKSTMKALFGVQGAQGKLPVAIWDDTTALNPDPDYVMEPERMFDMASAAEHGETVWLAGEAGTGKTTLAREYAALTKRGFVRIGFTRATELVDLLGMKEPEPGEFGSVKMKWSDHVFTQAVRRPGTVILLDEVTICPPGTSAAFQTILDERRFTVATGETIVFAQGVVVIVADNTAGYGDESGVYAGTQGANAALVDRAVRTVVVDYLKPELEAEALCKRTHAPQAACIRLADFAAIVRKTHRDQGEARPFSIRRLVAFMNATYRDLIDVDRAWQITALSRLPEADRETLQQCIRAQFDAAAFKRELKGEAAPAPTSNAPEQVAARNAFDAV